MPALDRLAAGDAVRAMQAINVTAPRGLAVPLAVSGLGSLAVGGWALARSSGSAAHCSSPARSRGRGPRGHRGLPRAPQRRAGRVRRGDRRGDGLEGYAPGWVAMNHVRAALSLASAALLVAGVVKGG